MTSNPSSAEPNTRCLRLATVAMLPCTSVSPCTRDVCSHPCAAYKTSEGSCRFPRLHMHYSNREKRRPWLGQTSRADSKECIQVLCGWSCYLLLQLLKGLTASRESSLCLLEKMWQSLGGISYVLSAKSAHRKQHIFVHSWQSMQPSMIHIRASRHQMAAKGTSSRAFSNSLNNRLRSPSLALVPHVFASSCSLPPGKP